MSKFEFLDGIEENRKKIREEQEKDYEKTILLTEKLLKTGFYLLNKFALMPRDEQLKNKRFQINRMLFIKNLNLNRESLYSILEANYNLSAIAIRCVMDNAYLMMSFSNDDNKVLRWLALGRKEKEMEEYIEKNRNDKTTWGEIEKKRKEISPLRNEFKPEELRNKLFDGDEKLKEDHNLHYSALSKYVHPNLDALGEFVQSEIKRDKDAVLTQLTAFQNKDKRLTDIWFNNLLFSIQYSFKAFLETFKNYIDNELSKKLSVLNDELSNEIERLSKEFEIARAK